MFGGARVSDQGSADTRDGVVSARYETFGGAGGSARRNGQREGERRRARERGTGARLDTVDNAADGGVEVGPRAVDEAVHRRGLEHEVAFARVVYDCVGVVVELDRA